MYQTSHSPEPAHRVVGVRFRPAGRVYYYDPAGFQLKIGQWVIVESSKGLECGRVVILPRQVEIAELGGAELKPVLRLAEEDDLRRMLSFKAREKEALRRCAQRVAQHDLPMKLAEAEYTFDGSRLTFYFTAEERVDFRRAGARPRGHFPHAHRTATDRRARPCQAAGRRGHVWQDPLL